MAKSFKVGDKVSWHYADNTVSGEVIKVHTKDFTFKEAVHKCSKEDPQYEVKSDKTDKTAVHKGSALTKK